MAGTTRWTTTTTTSAVTATMATTTTTSTATSTALPALPAEPFAYNHTGVTVLWVLIAIAVSLLVYYMARRRTAWYVLAAVSVGWIFPFSIVFLLPVDLSSTMFRRCDEAARGGNSTATLPGTTTCEQPLLLVSTNFLWAAWRAIYWTMFNLTFFVIPILQAYVDSGYFTAWERFKKALRRNVIYYAGLGVLGAVLLFWIAIQRGWRNVDDIMGFAMAGANLFGLSIVVVLLAFGLVELPRHVWHLGNRQRSLRYIEFQAPKVKDRLDDADTELRQLETEVFAISQRITFHDDMRPFVDRVLETIGKNAEDVSAEGGSDGSAEYRDLDLIKLAKLHKNVRRAVRAKERAAWEWKNLCRKGFHLQDIVSNVHNPEMKFRSSLSKVPESRFKELILLFQWIWYEKIETFLYRFLAVLAVAMSVVIIWSETVYMIPSPPAPLLSIIGITFHAPGVSYATVEMLSVMFLLYMCLCAMFSLFRVRLFDTYSLHPDHNTSEVSLCWFTSYMCRLTFPLCYNFTNMAGNKDAIFSKLMGEMNLAPIIGANFQFYVPVVIVVICVLNVFDIVGRLARAVGYKDDLFGDGSDGNAGDWGDAEDGKILLAEARGQEERSRGVTGGALLSDLRRDSSSRLISPTSTGTATSTSGATRPTKRSDSAAAAAVVADDKPLSRYKQNNPLYEKYANKQKTRQSDDGPSTQSSRNTNRSGDQETLVPKKGGTGPFNNMW